MRSRGILRALLLLLLLGAVPMEALFLSRLSLIRWVHDAYPHVVMDREGEVRYYDSEQVADGRWTYVPFDAERRVIDSMAPRPDVALGAWGWSYGQFPSLEPRFLRQHTPRVQLSVLQMLANVLNAREAQRRDLRPPALVVAAGGAPMQGLKPMPLHWQPEEGRLICRETATGRILAGIGPEGYTRGEAAAGSEAFSEVGPSLVLGSYATEGPWPGFAILEGDRRIVALLAPGTPVAQLPPDSVEPMELVVERRPLGPPDGRPQWTESPWIARTEDEILILHTDGSRIGRIRLEPGESTITTAGDRSAGSSVHYSANGAPFRPSPPQLVGISTSLMPSHPATKRIRMRLYRPLLPAVQREVVLEPMRPSETIPADFAAALTLLRPPPLNVAASLSPLPKDSADSLRWWWRDPWLADWSYPGWPVASLALAAFCAWRARRAARERCATIRAVRFWTAAVFLLGPIGLLWMRFVLPRVPVEAIADARRAVNLDASPSASAPWPEPKPQGIEVFS